MYEANDFLYQGYFTFKFSKSSQKVLAKEFLKAIFPEEIIKAARGKKLANYTSEEQEKTITTGKELLKTYTPVSIKLKIEGTAQIPERKHMLIALYLFFKSNIELISDHSKFYIKDELGQMILSRYILPL